MRERIKALNDFFRENWLALGPDTRNALGKFVCTRGICALPGNTRAEVLSRVVHFNEFTPFNDPFSEHDCGTFTQDGEKLLWKIDYYNRDMSAGSENPADPNETVRVLTIMLAREY